MTKIQKSISINPEIRFGKPCIKGTRIAVWDILGWLAGGMTYAEILEDFPQLTQEGILASLALRSQPGRAYKDFDYSSMRLLFDENISY